MNKFDYIIISLFVLLIFGVYGGGFQPVRVFSVVVFIIYIKSIMGAMKLKANAYSLFFVVFTALYAFVSVFYIYDNINNSLLSYSYLVVNLMLFSIVFMCFKRGNNPFFAAGLGSLFFCLVAVPYGLYEINTGKHLVTGLIDGEALALRDYSSFTFGNYNNFVLVLLMTLPFVLSLMNYKNIWLNISCFLVFCGIIFIILTDGSRAGMIGIVISCLYLYFLRRGMRWRSILIFCVALAIINIGDDFQFFFTRLQNQGLSDEARQSVISDMFPFFLDQLMMGFGIGNFSYYAKGVLNLEVYAPHNLFFEILYELGVFVFILFIGLFVKIFINSFKCTRQQKIFIYFALLMIIPFSVVNSGYILSVHMWLFISVLLGFSGRKEVSS